MSALDFTAFEPAPPRRSALRRLWQRLPQNTRSQILFDVSRLIAPLPDANPRGGLPLGIAGLFSTASGIGEGARLAYASLEAAGMAPAAYDLSPAFGQSELGEARRRALAPGAGSLIVHHNAPYLPHALWTLGRACVRGRRIIGYWAWELPRLPEGWKESFRYLHEIWVPSTFTRDRVAGESARHPDFVQIAEAFFPAFRKARQFPGPVSDDAAAAHACAPESPERMRQIGRVVMHDQAAGAGRQSASARFAQLG